MERAVAQASETGLTGVLLTPGPDLVYFTGYEPIAITERITMLVLQGPRDPTMILPILERPDAESAPGAAALSLARLDGRKPTPMPPPLSCSTRAARTRSPTRPGPCMCSASSRRYPTRATCR